MPTGITYALLAAALFGASTPIAKLLLVDTPPLLLAGLLYLGSGIGLAIARLVRDGGWQNPGLVGTEARWLAGATFFGGILGPAALMYGLSSLDAASASLLLNMEGVLTAVLAWVVFRENADRRIVIGMASIVAGGIVLAWPADYASASATWPGTSMILAACLCWAIDNNLTRKVSARDALFVAGIKGLSAGTVSVALALSLGMTMPPLSIAAIAMVVGLVGYGASLVLFVLALRALGTARTGAYFATAPFIGATLALAMTMEVPTAGFGLAATLMALGVWLHVTEHHEHLHRHDAETHDHPHVHDEHHQHQHDFPWDGSEPHTHPHRHTALVHTHAHFPDLDHRHSH
jgi:drug/metabolite transporter (DMT)-like permease